MKKKWGIFTSSQKLAGNAEGAKRPTAGDEGCEVRAQNLAPLLHPEGGRCATGRVPPFIEKLRIFFLIIFVLWVGGCGGGSDSKKTVIVPIPVTDLSGTMTVPNTVNELLLARVSTAQNTDSVVRKAFAGASVWVNDAQNSNLTITPSAVSTNWDFRILDVPKNAQGLYKIHVVAGKVGLRSWVSANDKDSFSINSRTTAAALLAESSKMDANGLLATFPAMVAKVANQIEAAFNASTTVVTTNVLSHPDVLAEVASQAALLKSISDFDPSAKAAYLGTSNDLDGDGKNDLYISQTIDRTGIRFLSGLSDETTMMAAGSGLASYSNSTLLDDFAQNRVRTDRTFDGSAKNVILGFYFNRSASSDTYLKLLIRKVDLSEGSFIGVLAEYEFVTATGTAIATGTKILGLVGSNMASGTYAGTNFLSDLTATAAGYLGYLDTGKGLGNHDGITRMIRAVDGQPNLENLSYAEAYGEGGAGYFVNAKDALKAINKERETIVGDVFSVFFPFTRHYALLKISNLASDSVTVNYIVNSAPDEPKF